MGEQEEGGGEQDGWMREEQESWLREEEEGGGEKEGGEVDEMGEMDRAEEGSSRSRVKKISGREVYS